MSELIVDPLEYYAGHSPITDPREHTELFEQLPQRIRALCKVVQGILIHVYHAHRYGVELSEERKQEMNLRRVALIMARVRELDDRPLVIARPPESRVVGTCRDFATLLCALLRHQGKPARARCGFATYFTPGEYEDHWVCEYWNATKRRWVMVDAQLDEVQREALHIDFDPYDVPQGRFLPGGRAWQLCRSGQANPEHFGIFDMRGMRFVRGNLVRDLASLNKMELLPWDCWGLIEGRDQDIARADLIFLDRVADLTLAGNKAFPEMRLLYESDSRVRVPPLIKSYTKAGVTSASPLGCC